MLTTAVFYISEKTNSKTLKMNAFTIFGQERQPVMKCTVVLGNMFPKNG